MCRWMLYKGERICLDEVLIHPERSLYSLALDNAYLPGAHFRKKSIVDNRIYKQFLTQVVQGLHNNSKDTNGENEGDGHSQECSCEHVSNSSAKSNLLDEQYSITEIAEDEDDIEMGGLIEVSSSESTSSNDGKVLKQHASVPKTKQRTGRRTKRTLSDPVTKEMKSTKDIEKLQCRLKKLMVGLTDKVVGERRKCHHHKNNSRRRKCHPGSSRVRRGNNSPKANSPDQFIEEELPPVSNTLGKRISLPNRASVVSEYHLKLSNVDHMHGSRSTVFLPNADIIPHAVAHSSQVVTSVTEEGRRLFSWWAVTMHMLRNHVRNLDGFGFAWYDQESFEHIPGMSLDESTDKHLKCCGYPADVYPEIYRSVKPIHTDEHVRELCSRHEADLIFAHVRAATGTSVSEENCHPFVFKRFTFMHNGGIKNFSKVEHKLASVISKRLLQHRTGQTDSELAFFLFLHFLADLEKPRYGKYEMLNAMRKVLQWIEECTLEHGASSLNFAVTDGQSVVATRYRSSAFEPPPSLYFAKVKQKYEDSRKYCGKGECRRCNSRKSTNVVISSEPYGERSSEGKFHLIPRNTLVLVDVNNHVYMYPQFRLPILQMLRRWRLRAMGRLAIKKFASLTDLETQEDRRLSLQRTV